MAKKGKTKTKGRKHGDRLFGIVLFIVVISVALLSVWYGLAPAGEEIRSQDEKTIRPYTLAPGNPTLSTCVTQDTVIMRLKVKLRIIINNTELRIPARIGITSDCVRPIHTKDISGTIYVESPVNYPYTLRSFFAVWNQWFTKDRLFFLSADANHKILMTVNGKPSLDFENHVLVDSEQVGITYA